MFILIVIVLIGLFDCLLIYSACTVSDEEKALEDKDQVEYLENWKQKKYNKKYNKNYNKNSGYNKN